MDASDILVYVLGALIYLVATFVKMRRKAATRQQQDESTHLPQSPLESLFGEEEDEEEIRPRRIETRETWEEAEKAAEKAQQSVARKAQQVRERTERRFQQAERELETQIRRAKARTAQLQREQEEDEEEAKAEQLLRERERAQAETQRRGIQTHRSTDPADASFLPYQKRTTLKPLPTRYQALLRNRQSARDAFVLSEILQRKF
ncbi:hypothetical protein SAMN05421823_102456 [Catalinimonas alkaloidigena]|uniref:Uncharacterized protein n=1 Tax=Catalinimonas alkaloidigena TaxID=1075417 RepID=A0A1G9AZ72_9BACT|nr:hypothetical protein [Catalinimonas alkaloidigena]SDK32636.1 hypothetical protein SAMN05421823_102456 [Catalinimonas alkaloidigena]